MPGTGSSGALTGFHRRAANRVPSDIGIQKCWVSSISHGSAVTFRIRILRLIDFKVQGVDACFVDLHGLLVGVSRGVNRGQHEAVAVLAEAIG